jgi:hypothetical protein
MLIPLVALNACSSDKDGEDEDVLAESDDSEDGEDGESPAEGDAGEEEESAESAASSDSAEAPPPEEPASGGGATDFSAMLKAMGGQAPAPAAASAEAAPAAAAEAAAAPDALAPKAAKMAKPSKAGKAGKAAAGKTRKLKSAVLAVREGPSLQAKIVGYIHGDMSVTIVAEGWNGWTKIGPKRFVRSKYLTAGGAKTVGAGKRSFVVKSEALYIRNAPSLDATVVGVLTSGDKVRAEPVSSGWVQLGPRRFVRAKYLEVLGH